MATAIRIARLEPGFYRTRADMLTGEEARMLADEINDKLNDIDELENESIAEEEPE